MQHSFSIEQSEIEIIKIIFKREKRITDVHKIAIVLLIAAAPNV
jgi:hypothetical protein